jgi:hypothetical protein
MPLLLRGLSLPDPTLRAGVIDTLLSAAQADVEAGLKTAKEGSLVAEHAVSLTNIMLKNSTATEIPDMVSRAPLFFFVVHFTGGVSDIERVEGASGRAQVLGRAPDDCALRCTAPAEGDCATRALKSVG